MNLTINPSGTDNPLEDLQILHMCMGAIGDLMSPDVCARLRTAENQDRLCLLLGVLHDLQNNALLKVWARQKMEG